MYNRKIKRNLYMIFFISVLLSIGVLFIGERLIKILYSARYDSVETSLATKAEAYKLQVDRQIDSDVENLISISSFFNTSKFSDAEILYNTLHEVNKTNHFMIMYSIYKNGEGVESIINREDISYININELEPELQRIYEESINGKIVVSDVFFSDYLENNVVAISVPIYGENKDYVEGVIIAYDTIDQFSYSLNISIKSNEETDYVNMVDSNGNFIIKSSKILAYEDSTSIYNMKISSLDEEKVKVALSNGQDYYSLFTLGDNNYAIYFKQLNYKNWYIYLINSVETKDDYILNVLSITRISFIFIGVITVFFGILAYFILVKNSKMLTKLAYHDELTGAYNSNKFRSRCEHLLKTQNDYSIVVFNIKKFKFINNIFGEKWADELLVYIKKVLDRNTYKNEYYCRESSDQFFVFIKSTDKDEIINRVNKIKNDIQVFSYINNQNYNITIYGGICSYLKLDDPSIIYKTMLDNALFIMKEEKENKESFIFYDESIYKKRYKQIYIENNMQDSLNNNEFKLFLQPKVDSKTKKVIGAEALVRWIKDDGTMIYPNEFIPLFEENGFCEKLDLYMIEKACEKIRSWIDDGIKSIPISINQSKLSFYKANYIDSICDITQKYNISNSFIVIEILERLALDNITEFNNTIEKLQEKGFRVSMDDFGSGYSSLNSLSKLKIDELKIDGDFLLKMGNDIEFKNKQKIILSSIISLAKKLNVQTVVEGVEDEEHLEFINDLGYDMAQGYYFSKPISAKEFDDKYMN
ncbi:EAL domain-containing protein [Clostridium cuniculi]|uniref:bifunctional diguanylate cyclase/phosphodiesterase n=1 Tax=Clostridium cuniculi TaxID=2548455 RepID=UPI001055A103|nr:EAL domain-containing protein [Clostridium cuniculi]